MRNRMVAAALAFTLALAAHHGAVAQTVLDETLWAGDADCYIRSVYFYADGFADIDFGDDDFDFGYWFFGRGRPGRVHRVRVLLGHVRRHLRRHVHPRRPTRSHSKTKTRRLSSCARSTASEAAGLEAAAGPSAFLAEYGLPTLAVLVGHALLTLATAVSSQRAIRRLACVRLSLGRACRLGGFRF